MVNTALLDVDHHHLSGAQTAFFADFGGVEGQNAHFGGHHDGVVVGNEVAGGAEAVAVEHAAGVASGAEQQGGGAVPGLHKHGVVFVERLKFG